MVSLTQIFDWFKENMIPSEAQFRETWSSFWHKSEKLPQSQILGLNDALNDKASKEDLQNVVAGLRPMGSVDTEAELIAIEVPNDNDSYFVKETADGNGNPYIWRWDANLNDWINTELVVYEDVVRKSELEIPSIEIVHVDYNKGYYITSLNLTTNIHEAFSISDYKSVKEGDVIIYSGRTGSNGVAVVGYDNDKANPILLLGSAGSDANDYYNEKEVIIPFGISFIRTSGQFKDYTNYPLPIVLSCSIVFEKEFVVTVVVKNTNDIKTLDDGLTDYEMHRDGIEAKIVLLSPIWISGYWTESGTGSSESWIYTEVDIVDFDSVKLLFACPVTYIAKSYFVTANGAKVGDLIGSDLGDTFIKPNGAVKLRISNRIVGDGIISGIPEPTITGVINGVSKFASEQYVIDNISVSKNKYCHMSFDDVHGLWIDLFNNVDNYESVFDNSFLEWLKDMHNRYGIVCTLILDMTEYLETYPIPMKFRQEFIDNMDWLKLGFQAKTNKDYRLETYDTALADYNEFAENIVNLFGTWEIIDRVVRNNFFHSNIDVANGLRDAKCGAIGFLGCDDWSYNAPTRIVNVYLTDAQSKALDKRDRLYDYINDFWIFKTDFRFEQVNQRWGNINNCIADYESLNRANEAYDLVVFSHENYYPSLSGMMETFFLWAKNKGYRFDFPMNVLLKN